MKPTKKNKFFNFIFAFCPGASEMYMGFMKNGFSLLAIFLALCVAVGPMRADFLLAGAMLIYCFGFFHARNIAHMDDETFAAYEDKYIWEEFINTNAFKIKDTTMRKIMAVVMIFIGVGLAWGYITDLAVQFIPTSYWDDIYPIIEDIPSLVVAIILIVAGALLIRGKKKELTQEEVNA